MKELSLNILDIVQNSIRAGAGKIEIEIRESEKDDLYIISITDNGSGIPEEILQNVTNPFVTTRTERKIGLGLPLLKYHAEMAGGGLKITSEPGKGTEVEAVFRRDHIDRQPLGDIIGVLKILVAANPDKDIIYKHISDNGEYIFSSEETRRFLEVDSLSDNTLLKDIGDMIGGNLKEIGASGINYTGCI